MQGYPGDGVFEASLKTLSAPSKEHEQVVIDKQAALDEQAALNEQAALDGLPSDGRDVLAYLLNKAANAAAHAEATHKHAILLGQAVVNTINDANKAETHANTLSFLANCAAKELCKHEELQPNAQGLSPMLCMSLSGHGMPEPASPSVIVKACSPSSPRYPSLSPSPQQPLLSPAHRQSWQLAPVSPLSPIIPCHTTGNAMSTSTTPTQACWLGQHGSAEQCLGPHTAALITTNQFSASVNLALTTIVDCVQMEECGSTLMKEFCLDEEELGSMPWQWWMMWHCKG